MAGPVRAGCGGRWSSVLAVTVRAPVCSRKLAGSTEVLDAVVGAEAKNALFLPAKRGV